MNLKKSILVGMVFILISFLAFGMFSNFQEKEKQKSARDLFFVGAEEPSTPEAAPPQPPAGINYKIIKLVTNQSGCDFQWADVKKPFKTGDRIKLVVTSNTDGYLYIFNQGTSGAGQTLFPHLKINEGKNEIKKGVEYTIPPVGWWEFKGPKGTEKINMFLCRKPIAAFTSYVVPANIQAVPVNIILELEKGINRDLQFVDTAAAPQIQGVQLVSPVQSFFIVNISQDPEAIVSVQLDLIHK